MQFFTREDQKISTATENIQFSGPVNVIHQRRLPETAIPAGYCALLEAYNLQVPVPIRLAAIGERHRVINTPDWLIMTPWHQPQASLRGHLTFALKYEGLDLAVLKRLFEITGSEPIEQWVREEPTGSYARRTWFLFEWLEGNHIELPDATGGAVCRCAG